MDTVKKIQNKIAAFVSPREQKYNFSITYLVRTASFSYFGNALCPKEKKLAIADFVLNLICRDAPRNIEASDLFIRACLSQKDLLHIAYGNTNLAGAETLEDVLLRCIEEGTAVGAQKVLTAIGRDITEKELRALFKNWKSEKRSNEEASMLRAFAYWFPDSLVRMAIMNATHYKPMINVV